MYGRQGDLVAVAVLFLVLTWLAVGMRVYTRWILLQKWGHDDTAMGITLILFTLSVAMQIGAVAYGLGRHVDELSAEDMRIALVFCYWYEILYVLVGVSLKVALGIFYLRIAVERWQILVIKCIMYGASAFGVVCVLLVIFQCVPVHTFWTIYPSNSNCIPTPAQSGLTFTLNAMNACTDWILGTIPFFMVRHLNMSFRTKVLVCAILAFAAVGSTGTIVRMKYVPNLYVGREFLYSIIDVSIWSTVEPGIGITAASIATLRPLLQNILWRLGFAPPPSHVTARPISSEEDGSPDPPRYRLGWFRPTHRPPGRVTIGDSIGTIGTTTTITGSVENTK